MYVCVYVCVCVGCAYACVYVCARAVLSLGGDGGERWWGEHVSEQVMEGCRCERDGEDGGPCVRPPQGRGRLLGHRYLAPAHLSLPTVPVCGRRPGPGQA